MGRLIKRITPWIDFRTGSKASQAGKPQPRFRGDRGIDENYLEDVWGKNGQGT